MRDAGTMKTVWILAAMALVMAGVMSYFAYSKPDALEHSLAGHSTDGSAAVSAQDTRAGNGAPLADYGVPGVRQPFFSSGLAGIIGTVMVFVAVSLVAWALKYRRGISRRAC